MKRRINNTRFSVRFCFVMKALGITTVGQAQKFFDKTNDNLSIHHIRVCTLRKELREFLR